MQRGWTFADDKPANLWTRPSDRALAGAEQQRTMSQPPTAVFELSAERLSHRFLSAIYYRTNARMRDSSNEWRWRDVEVWSSSTSLKIPYSWSPLCDPGLCAGRPSPTPMISHMGSGLGCRPPMSDRSGSIHQYLIERIASTSSKSTRKCVFYALLFDRWGSGGFIHCAFLRVAFALEVRYPFSSPFAPP